MADEKSIDEMILTEDEIEITYKFTYSEEHKAFMTNRIWGGIQTGGLFEINFMLEHKPMPTTTAEKISKSGLTEETMREQGEELIRENQATVYMPLETLLTFHQWLGRKIDELRKLGVILEQKREE